MDVIQTLLITLVIFIALVLLYSLIAGSGVAKAQKRRMQALRYRHSESVDAKVDAQFKRAVAARKPKTYKVAGSGSRTEALAMRLNRTGKTWTVTQYIYATVGLALAFSVVMFVFTQALMLSLGVGLLLGAGLPHMVVGRLINKRTNAFVSKFPDGIELLVRGLRSGLPVTETLQIVSTEVPGPVGYEFKTVIDRIKVGKTMEDALQDTADKLGIPEFNFFTITLAIQRETGGNLAETLSNLANVLRQRAQMKLKIKAMSAESKASAYIVGSLPFIVFGMILYINPEYMGGFFTDDRLIVTGLGAGVWMGIGVAMMAKMVNFEI
ncbi:type II secretion system F family protein [Erythrobacter sp. BLCC-B19]|uniref:type II secretion system F family protein n=1 Tax=Erythrobacter sp. BLCC-B19 TaxID=3025315 RepID=UPI00235F31C2|nr:type II secretion system F family protein [Erythrobacter sp. BLCC-B19]WDA39895.1 type II secretion system F family protein [Erythrobacter sp. BLCC-B19]